MTEMTTAHAVDRPTAQHNRTWLYRGAGARLRCSYGAIGAIGALRDIAEAPGCAAAVLPDAKDLFPEDHPSTPASTVDP